MNEVNTTAPAIAAPKVIVAGRFDGMLHSFQMNAYNTLIACSIEKPVAHKVASDFGSDIGRMMRSDSDLSSKVAKANKDGESRLTIKGGGKIKMSDSMRLVRLAQIVHETYKEGLTANKDLPDAHKQVETYLAECIEWAAGQSWA